MSLAQRSVRSATWATFTTIAALPVNFVHSVLLARLLPVEYFGIYAGVNSVLVLSSTFFEFGFTNAFLHRSPETEDEGKAASAFFTLRLIFETLWALSLIIFGWIAFSDLRRFVLIVLVVASYTYRLTLTPKALLIRRVQHRRLALIDLAASVISALVSILIAFLYQSIWALLVSSLIMTAASITGFYIWKPLWKPRLSWDWQIVRYYFGFGSRNLVNNILDSALDNLDNLWTNFYLGDALLGFYSRAFKFSIYPRMILATPITSVAIGTYAELKQDRKRLTRAFFQTNAFLTRAGFFLAGWLAVIAPYFIQLLLGERWLPMLTAFRLMLIFAMLDPIKGTISSLLIAVGDPQKISAVRIAQLIVLIAGLFGLGTRFQTAGVAMAMDLMVVTGTILSILYVRPYIDISWIKLFSAPLVSIAIAVGATWFLGAQLSSSLSFWWTAGIKTLLFPIIYFTILFAMEGNDILQNTREILGMFSIQGWFSWLGKNSNSKD